MDVDLVGDDGGHQEKEKPEHLPGRDLRPLSLFTGVPLHIDAPEDDGGGQRGVGAPVGVVAILVSGNTVVDGPSG